MGISWILRRIANSAKIPKRAAQMRRDEILLLTDYARAGFYAEAVVIAFLYGRAKGYNFAVRRKKRRKTK